MRRKEARYEISAERRVQSAFLIYLGELNNTETKLGHKFILSSEKNKFS